MIQTCEPSRAAPSKETADERACPSRSHRQYQHCRNHSAHYSRPNHTPLCVARVMKSSHANAPTHTRERTNERESISAFRFSQFSQRLALLVLCCSLPCCCCCVVVVALPPGSSSRHQRRCALTMAAQSPREIASDCGGSSSPVAVSSSECVEQQRQPSNIDGGGSPATTTRTSTNNINARSSSSSDGVSGALRDIEHQEVELEYECIVPQALIPDDWHERKVRARVRVMLPRGSCCSSCVSLSLSLTMTLW